MFATPAKTDVLQATDVRAGIDTERALVFAAPPADDDLRPARGIVLGMGLGSLSIGLLATLVWWLL